MLLLTASTGIVDAVGFLGLDRVFTGNMTGNVVLLGMGLSGTTDLPVLGPVVALAAFVVGAAIGGRAVRGRAAAWSDAVTIAIGAVALSLAATAAWMLVAPPSPMAGAAPSPVLTGATAILGLIMGVQAAVARHVRVADLTTVVVTSTLTGVAADSWIGARLPQPWLRRLLAIGTIGVGALAGALLLALGLWAAIAAAAAVTGSAALWGHLLLRAERRKARAAQVADDARSRAAATA
ncbi:YoaK family protein [Agrococcus sp. SL85]|uniref:DUF1275 family protein n=1 Tax=Agrococcus sp. SL85 TaxID=2995141 RepID=UPI00226C8E71|nr:YoaK family protein [Agrococcus sp. SL85]WAC65685.1 YoaK family protein [Agrococcus sp. SL85]